MKILFFLFFIFVLSDHFVAFYEDEFCTQPTTYFRYSQRCLHYRESQYLQMTCTQTMANLTLSSSQFCNEGIVMNTYVNNGRCNFGREGFYMVFCNQDTEPFTTKILSRYSNDQCLLPHTQQGVVTGRCIRLGATSLTANCLGKILLIRTFFSSHNCQGQSTIFEIQPNCHRNVVFGFSKALNC